MRKLLNPILFCIALFSTPILAGSGHDHDHGHSHGSVSSDVTSDKAVEKINSLVQAEKIDSSWSGLKPVSVEQKTYSKGPEWVVTFKNSKVSDTSKQTLYLFYSLDGHYIAANYTGE